MTVEQQSGRAIILLSLVVFLVVSLAILVWDASSNGAAVLAGHLPRLLIGVPFLFLLRGNATARWILVAALVAGAGIGVLPMISGAPAAAGGVLLALTYVVLAGILATSSSVNSFLAYAKRRAEIAASR